MYYNYQPDLSATFGAEEIQPVCELDETTCGGVNADFIVQCADDDNDGDLEWSIFNHIFCEAGCNATTNVCNTPLNLCINYCDENETICGGTLNNYLILCQDDNDDGCFEWSVYNQTYCTFGCESGSCRGCFNMCTLGSSKCFGKYIRDCVDENNDGCFEWGITNQTFCKWECFVNVSTSGYPTAYCGTGAGNVSVMTGIERALKRIGFDMGILFPSFGWQATALTILILALIVSIIHLSGVWEIGIILGLGVAWMGTVINWYPFYATIILTMGGIVIFWTSK
jgi:hypothetical protein